jgi:hypothetical protein
MPLAASAVPLLALALLLAGCASDPPTGPAEQPEAYPDLTTPDAAWRTYVYAWARGDLDVLGRVTGGMVRVEHERRIEKNGRERTAEWYRADPPEVLEAEWHALGKAKAFLDVALRSPRIARLELHVALTHEPGRGWLVTGLQSQGTAGVAPVRS